MLRIYRMPNGRTFQFEEKEAPAEAVLIEQKAPEKKAAAPKNKAVTPKNKAVRK